MLSISIGIYNKGVEQISRLLLSEAISLPNGDYINVQNLHHSVKREFIAMQRETFAPVQECKCTYKDSIAQLYTKFNSYDYQQ